MLFGMSVASSMTLYMNCAVKSCLMHSFRLSTCFFFLLFFLFFFMVEGNLVTPWRLRHPSKELSEKNKKIRAEVPSPRKAPRF